jgi:hypothetical protein
MEMVFLMFLFYLCSEGSVGIRKAMKERNLNGGQWEDRKQWSLGVGKRRKSF